jgi:hypothetical protein
MAAGIAVRGGSCFGTRKCVTSSREQAAEDSEAASRTAQLTDFA